ncbi:MAG: NERD domain-containing protein [Holosporales bacterium]|jgi:hypothetical protein|nr:NERD domain-containing protein [Holosporales bacterium]
MTIQNNNEVQKIFNKLAEVCTRPGYMYALAYLQARSCFLSYKKNTGLTEESLAPVFSEDALENTEISTLFGLTVKGEIDFSFPGDANLQEMIQTTIELLRKMHLSLLMIDEDEQRLLSISADQKSKLFSNAEHFMEPVFYRMDPAYSFQFTEFAEKMYAKDNEWFLKNKGYSVSDMRNVFERTRDFQNDQPPCKKFEFTAKDIADYACLDLSIVEKALDSFCIPKDNKNERFTSLEDFNIVNASPLIKNEDRYILLQQYRFCEASYESPFYWMIGDSDYKEQAKKNRGAFVEDFAKEKLTSVFGKENVFSNANIYRGKDIVGEIDALVVFADRAIVVQAKAKKLRIESRKGNDQCFKEDFKKAVQDAYDQGLKCAQALERESYKLKDSNDGELNVNRKFKEIYICCLLAEAYPALILQVSEFLKYEKYKEGDKILSPLVLTVFALDTITEMLSTPLYFLSYLEGRAKAKFEIDADDETVVLAHHLKRNLFIGEDCEVLLLDKNCARELEAVMMNRRLKIPGGKDYVEGDIEARRKSFVGKIISFLESDAKPEAIDLGRCLLLYNAEDINKNILRIIEATKKDKGIHDFSMKLKIDDKDIGLVVHCNDFDDLTAFNCLRYFCEKRLADWKLKECHGILIDSMGDIRVCFACLRS